MCSIAIMDLSSCLNSVGLVFDIAGVLGLFKFGLPSKLFTDNTIVLNEYDHKKEATYRKMSNWSLASILVGFLLQLVSNFL